MFLKEAASELGRTSQLHKRSAVHFTPENFGKDQGRIQKIREGYETWFTHQFCHV